MGTVSEKLMHKMSVQAPPKITVEKYMIEIAKYYNVEYEPDPQVYLWRFNQFSGIKWQIFMNDWNPVKCSLAQ